MTKSQIIENQASDITKDLFDSEERQILQLALKTYSGTVARKATAQAPTAIRELWENELHKITNLQRKLAQ